MALVIFAVGDGGKIPPLQQFIPAPLSSSGYESMLEQNDDVLSFCGAFVPDFPVKQFLTPHTHTHSRVEFPSVLPFGRDKCNIGFVHQWQRFPAEICSRVGGTS